MPFILGKLVIVSGESAATLCLFAGCQDGLEAEFCVEDLGDGSGADTGASALVEASNRAFRIWDARLALAVWPATAARATDPGARVVRNWGPRRNGAALSPETGVCAPRYPFVNNVSCARDPQILVAQVPPHGVLVSDHAGRVINKLSLLITRPA